MGHARALLGCSTTWRQRASRARWSRKALSVRETEALVKQATPARARAAKRRADKDVHTRAAEERFASPSAPASASSARARAGRIEIDFASEDELNRLYEQLTAK